MPLDFKAINEYITEVVEKGEGPVLIFCNVKFLINLNLF